MTTRLLPLLALLSWILCSSAFAESPAADYYREAVKSANGLSLETQVNAVKSMTAGQAAGLSYAGPQDVAAVLATYNPYPTEALQTQAASQNNSAPVNPTAGDPPPTYTETIQQTVTDDLRQSPAGDPNLVSDTRANAMQELQSNGKGAWIGAAQRENSGLDANTTTQGSWQVQHNTLSDSGYGCPAGSPCSTQWQQYPQ